MRQRARQSLHAAAVLAFAVGALAAAAPAPAERAGEPCCEVVPLASVGLPAGYPSTLAVSIALPAGYTAGPGPSFVAARAGGRITYAVAAGAQRIDGSAPLRSLRAATLAALGGGTPVADMQASMRHEVVPGRAGTQAPVGVGSLQASEAIARGARPGTYAGAVAFALANRVGAPVVVVRLASIAPCCEAAALRALRAALGGIALEGNLPATTVEAKLQPAKLQPCCQAVLTGSIADAYGEPVVGVAVSLAPAGATPCCEATTNALGVYSLRLAKSLRSGGYTLTVDPGESCCALERRLQLDLGGVPPPPGGAAPVNLLDPNRRWVVAHPRIVNLFWDSNWSKHNHWSRHTVDVATRDLAVSHYFDELAQYGVARPGWVGSHSPSVACGARRAPTSLTSARLLAWVTCEVSTLLPQSRLPVSDDLFVVYLPERTTIRDPGIPKLTVFGQSFGPFALPAQCTSWSGYHAASLGVTGPFAFAVVASRCANGDLRALTETASHELVEAMTDAVVTAGWIDDSYSLAPPTFDRLLEGEAGDICGPTGAHPMPAVAVMSGMYRIAPFWSNSAGTCVAKF